MGQAQPKRSVVGLDGGRLVMTLAVLARHAGLPVLGVDVFASVAGGIRVTEPAADLAVALAVASAATGVPLPADLAAVGEVGLAGEVRQVTNLPRRLEECGPAGLRPGGGAGLVPGRPRRHRAGPGGHAWPRPWRGSVPSPVTEPAAAGCRPRPTAGGRPRAGPTATGPGTMPL